MKKFLFILGIILSNNFYTQTIKHLKSEIDNIKSDVSLLRNEVATVKSQNIYLKKILDISNPILEVEKGGTLFKIIKVSGDSNKKEISVTLLIEPKDENTDISINESSIVDLEGNQYLKKDFERISGLGAGNSNTFHLNVPQKVIPIYVNVESKPQMIKLLKLRLFSTKESKRDKPGEIFVLEFKDINVTWN